MTTARGLLARTGLPQRESEVLLLSLLGRDRGWLFAHGDAPIAQHCEGVFMDGSSDAKRESPWPTSWASGSSGRCRYG